MTAVALKMMIADLRKSSKTVFKPKTRFNQVQGHALIILPVALLITIFYACHLLFYAIMIFYAFLKVVQNAIRSVQDFQRGNF